MQRITLGLLVCAVMAMGAPAAYSMGTCKMIPSWCPAPGGPSSGGPGHSVPEPGTLGLLAMGAAASIGMLRRKKR